MPHLPRRLSVRDAIAGLSVALVLVPQSLAYAEIAGLPTVAGLYAAALPVVAAAPFGSSRYLQIGPVALTALLTFGALSVLAEPGSPEYIDLAVLLAIVVGIVRLALGLLRGGAITNYMSPPVILGFSTAAAILISASQIGNATGYEEPAADLLPRLVGVVLDPAGWNWQAVILSVVVGALIVGGRRIHPVFPGVLVAVVVGLWVGSRSGFSAELVGTIPEGLPPFSFDIPWARIPDLLIPGAVIALVGFAEATAISRTLAVRDREHWDANRELVAIGIANITSGLSGGFPVGGSFSRSSINRLAGAHTRWASAFTGLAVLAFMPFAGVLSSLPRAVLGAVVIVAVYPLMRFDEIWRMTRVTRGQAGVAAFTLVATLALSPRVDLGVVLGMLAAGILHLYRESSRIHIPATHLDGCLTLQPHGVLYYGSAGALLGSLDSELARHGGCTTVRLDLSRLGRIDYTGFQSLQSFAEIVRGAELEFEVINLPEHARGLFERSGGLD